MLSNKQRPAQTDTFGRGLFLPTGKTGSRDSIRTKVFERKGVGFGRGKENFL